MKADQIYQRRKRLDQLCSDLELLLNELSRCEDDLNELNYEDDGTSIHLIDIKLNESKANYLMQGINLIGKEMVNLTEPLDAERFEPFEG